ncbi:MAG: DUF6580 family putative transport protein [Pirellulaceae bacterium]
MPSPSRDESKWGSYGFYPRTLEGLADWPHAAAVPFSQWTVLGDLAYTTALFGGLTLAQNKIPQLRVIENRPYALHV